MDLYTATCNGIEFVRVLAKTVEEAQDNITERLQDQHYTLYLWEYYGKQVKRQPAVCK